MVVVWFEIWNHLSNLDLTSLSPHKCDHIVKQCLKNENSTGKIIRKIFLSQMVSKIQKKKPLFFSFNLEFPLNKAEFEEQYPVASETKTIVDKRGWDRDSSNFLFEQTYKILF